MNNQRTLKLELLEAELDLILDSLACMALILICKDEPGNKDGEYESFLKIRDCKKLHDKLAELSVTVSQREVREREARGGTH